MWLHYRGLIVENVNKSQGKVPCCHQVGWLAAEEPKCPHICSVCSVCRSRMASGIIKPSTVGLFVKISTAPPCCFFKPCDIASSRSKHWELLWSEVNFFCQHALFGPPCQAISSPEFPALTRGRCYNAHVGQFYMKHIFFLGRLVAVKAPIASNPSSAARSSPLGSGSESRKALGVGGWGVEAGLIGKNPKGRWAYSCGSSCTSSFFSPHLKVFTEQVGHEQDMLLEAWGGKWKW